jgi:hypothetical protein
MKKTLNSFGLVFGARALALALAIIALCSGSRASAQEAAASVSADEATAIATDAYIYGYPLVTVEMTRRVLTNVAAPLGLRTPMGRFVNAREYPTAAFKDVTAPNADTLYSSAFLDLSKEPYILSIPDAKGRYYLMPMLDGWTTVFQVPGKRTTGTKAQKYAITGPGWSGTLPDGVTQYKSQTNMVWIIGRIYCTGTPADYKAVHAMQDELSLVPLSAYGKSYSPPTGTVDPSVDMKTPVRDQVNALDVAAYFNLMGRLMRDNPPTAEDAPIIARIAKIGIVPGQPFDLTKLSPEAQQAIKTVPNTAVAKIMGYFKDSGKQENGWAFFTKTGIYGTDYLDRGFITAVGLGANRQQDAVYPTSEVDADGKPYSGANKLRHALRQGADASGEWILVGDDVHCRVFLRRQSTQPLHAQRTQQPQDKCRWFSRPLPAARKSGQGQGIQLAARSRRQVHPDVATLLAQGNSPIVAGRHMDDPGSRGGSIIANANESRSG